jgi:hypothetical protein
MATQSVSGRPRNPAWPIAASATVESSVTFKKEPMPMVMQYLQ